MMCPVSGSCGSIAARDLTAASNSRTTAAGSSLKALFSESCRTRSCAPSSLNFGPAFSTLKRPDGRPATCSSASVARCSISFTGNCGLTSASGTVDGSRRATESFGWAFISSAISSRSDALIPAGSLSSNAPVPVLNTALAAAGC